MDLAEFDYHLPEQLIAQTPLPDRSGSRMLVIHRHERRWEDRSFRELPGFLQPDDCLVLNDSKVFPSRLYGRRKGVHSLPVGKHNPRKWQHLSGQVEVFLLRPVSDDCFTWQALVHPGRKMRVGEIILFGDALSAEIVGRSEHGERTVRFNCQGDLYATFEQLGHVPLPPYIRRPDVSQDRERYQTVFARERGSVAAPTAGLHFTTEILSRCRAAGASVAYVTLHVGLGTFQPLHTQIVEEAKLHSEVFRITEDNAANMRAAGRLLAVGTTSVRSLETAIRQKGLSPTTDETNIFIYPGFEFRATGALLTNFHLPHSSLLLLACAFGGKDLILEAYRHAVREGYRFYSYGDCMLIV